MATIHTPNGYDIFVDDVDFDWAQQRRWIASINRSKRPRVICIEKIRGKTTTITLARTLYKEKIDPQLPDNLVIEHKDGNGLNNSRTNLVPLSRRDAARFRYKVHPYKGQRGIKLTGPAKWEVKITYRTKVIKLGTFTSREQAEVAYSTARKNILAGLTPSGKKRPPENV